MKIKIQEEKYTEVLELTVGDDQYITLAVNLDISYKHKNRFYIIEELSGYPSDLKDLILEEAEKICKERRWFEE